MTNHTTHLGEYQDHLRAFVRDFGETFDSEFASWVSRNTEAVNA